MDRVSFILQNAKGKILDVGFVACSLHERIKENFPKTQIFGVDIEEVPKNPNYKQGSAEKIPFESEQFDTIVAGKLIEHVKHPNRFVKETRRLLKKGGIMILTTPNRNSWINRLTKNYHTKIHLSLFSYPELKELLEKNGLKVEKFFCLPFTEESSPGTEKKWFYPIRKVVHWFLPRSLQEEMVILARK